MANLWTQSNTVPASRAAAADGVAGEADGSLQLRIGGVVRESEAVISIEAGLDDGALLPSWQPGAHIDVMLPSGRVRHYSLCGDPANRSSYKFAVLREAHGRGGSIELHAIAKAGALLRIRAPRNRFQLADGQSFLFLAGGIGVTPLLPMVRAVEQRGRPWTFVYGGRSRASMAFTAELSNRRGGPLHIVPQDEQGHPDFERLFDRLDAAISIYACGPAAMLAAIEDCARRHGASSRLHTERFSAPPNPEPAAQAAPDKGFDVVLQRSGRTVRVPADRTLGSVLQAEGADVSFSCEEGICGTCETRVIAGIPDHRDSVLSPREKAGNDRMMVCVGRALSASLTLDA